MLENPQQQAVHRILPKKFDAGPRQFERNGGRGLRQVLEEVLVRHERPSPTL